MSLNLSLSPQRLTRILPEFENRLFATPPLKDKIGTSLKKTMPAGRMLTFLVDNGMMSARWRSPA